MHDESLVKVVHFSQKKVRVLWMDRRRSLSSLGPLLVIWIRYIGVSDPPSVVTPSASISDVDWILLVPTMKSTFVDSSGLKSIGVAGTTRATVSNLFSVQAVDELETLMRTCSVFAKRVHTMRRYRLLPSVDSAQNSFNEHAETPSRHARCPTDLCVTPSRVTYTTSSSDPSASNPAESAWTAGTPGNCDASSSSTSIPALSFCRAQTYVSCTVTPSALMTCECTRASISRMGNGFDSISFDFD